MTIEQCVILFKISCEPRDILENFLAKFIRIIDKVDNRNERYSQNDHHTILTIKSKKKYYFGVKLSISLSVIVYIQI